MCSQVSNIVCSIHILCSVLSSVLANLNHPFQRAAFSTVSIPAPNVECRVLSNLFPLMQSPAYYLTFNILRTCMFSVLSSVLRPV